MHAAWLWESRYGWPAIVYVRCDHACRIWTGQHADTSCPTVCRRNAPCSGRAHDHPVGALDASERSRQRDPFWRPRHAPLAPAHEPLPPRGPRFGASSPAARAAGSLARRRRACRDARDTPAVWPGRRRNRRAAAACRAVWREHEAGLRRSATCRGERRGGTAVSSGAAGGPCPSSFLHADQAHHHRPNADGQGSSRAGSAGHIGAGRGRSRRCAGARVSVSANACSGRACGVRVAR
jgi:hypothetical protein